MPEYEIMTGFDREIWYEELEDFVPQKIFDALFGAGHLTEYGTEITGRGSPSRRGGRRPRDHRPW